MEVHVMVGAVEAKQYIFLQQYALIQGLYSTALNKCHMHYAWNICCVMAKALCQSGFKILIYSVLPFYITHKDNWTNLCNVF